MLSRHTIDAVAEIQTCCHLAPSPSYINDILSDPKFQAIQRLLGIHVGIFGYISPTENSDRLYYLTNDEPVVDSLPGPREFTRKVRWPFLIDSPDGNWRLENPICERSRLEMAARVRRFEYSEGHSTSRSLEHLAMLSPGTLQAPEHCCRLEVDKQLLYAPMGEILAALVGWHLHFFEHLDASSQILLNLDQLLSPHDPDALLGSAAVRVLREIVPTRSNVSLLPTLALVGRRYAPGGRMLTWRGILQDLGIILDERADSVHLNQHRLWPLIYWLVQQSQGSGDLWRPTLQVDLTKGEKESFERFLISKNVSEESKRAVFSSVLKVLLRMRCNSSSEWERKFHFGFANHLIWMSAGRSSEARWLAPYDWACFQIIPGTRRVSISPQEASLPLGVAFLTIRSNFSHWDDIAKLRRRIERIRAFTLALATAENRFSYYEEISTQHSVMLDMVTRDIGEEIDKKSFEAR